MTHLTIAGRIVEEPLSVFEAYAKRYGRTLAKYDYAPQPEPNEITRQDVIATRIIASRINGVQEQQIVERARENQHLLQAIPVDAQIHDADPAEVDGLYDAMSALYAALQGPGVRDSKVSKVLHLKRPSLYPILDSALSKLYQQDARDTAARYPERGFRRMSWAAIRDDVITNHQGLEVLRPALAANIVLNAQRVHELSDLRLLDILAWNRQHG